MQTSIKIAAYAQLKKQLELREKLIEIEESRRVSISDVPARSASAYLRTTLKEKVYV